MRSPAETAALARGTRQVAVRRYGVAEQTAQDDSVVIEEPLQIQLAWPGGERNIAITMRTPGNDTELALGFLLTEGIIVPGDIVAAGESPDLPGSPGEPDSPEADDNTVCIRLTARPPLELLHERNFYISSSCGICGKTAMQAVKLRSGRDSADDAMQITPAALLSLPTALLQRQTLFAGTGSIHAAAAFDSNGQVQRVFEDVGRHNAVDKVIGAALLAAEIPLQGVGIFVSGRAGFELVQKAVMAGSPLLAAVGAPSSLAIELAWEAGLTLVGFLRDGRFNVYSCPDRIR